MIFSAGGSPLDRAGGALRLSALADSLVGRMWRLRVIDAGALFRLVVDSFPDGTPEDDQYTAVSPREDAIRVVSVASSAAVREDQRTLLEEDRDAISVLLEAEVARLAYARIPETEKRALDGDR